MHEHTHKWLLGPKHISIVPLDVSFSGVAAGRVCAGGATHLGAGYLGEVNAGARAKTQGTDGRRHTGKDTAAPGSRALAHRLRTVYVDSITIWWGGDRKKLQSSQGVVVVLCSEARQGRASAAARTAAAAAARARPCGGPWKGKGAAVPHGKGSAKEARPRRQGRGQRSRKDKVTAAHYCWGQENERERLVGCNMRDGPKATVRKTTRAVQVVRQGARLKGGAQPEIEERAAAAVRGRRRRGIMSRR